MGWLNSEVKFKTNSTVSQENWQLQIYLPKWIKWFHFVAFTSRFINPLNPNTKIQILICYPCTFSIEVVGRIC